MNHICDECFVYWSVSRHHEWIVFTGKCLGYSEQTANIQTAPNCITHIQCRLSESSLQGTVLGILSGQQSLFTQHLTPQQQQMYQQHMQLQHQAQHLKKIRRSLPHSTSDQGQQIHQQVCANRTTYAAGDLTMKFFHTCQLCLSLCVPSFLRVAEEFLIWHTVFSWLQKSFYRFYLSW